jgi:hypothetical protein
MNKILFNFKNFYFILLLLVFSGNTYAQCTVTGSVNTSTMPCSSYTGCTSVNIGNGSTATTLNFNANLDLTCLGAIQFVIKNNASVNFGSSDRLYLGAGSSIIVEAGGDISGSSCNASERIYIGGVLYASCNGGGGAVATFSDIETFGGSGSITTNSPVCVGNSINLSATPPPNGGPFTYTWYEPSVSTSTSIGTGQSISIASATSGSHIYQVKMYSASLNKTMISNATVVVSSASAPAAPTITAGGPTTFCSGGSVTLTSSAGTSYLWSTGATTQSISATTSGNYTVQVTNAGGCQSNSSATTTVTVRSLVNNVGTGFSGSSFCAGEQATITFDANNGSGVYPYTLVYRNDTTNATASVAIANDDTTTFNIVPNPTVLTHYTLLSITDANGCVRTSGFGDSTATVTINALPNAPIVGTITQPTCSVATGSVVLSGLPVGGAINPGAISYTGTTCTISGLGTGTYNYTVSNGTCASAVSTSVTIDPQPGTPNKPIITSYSLPTFADNDGTITLGNLPSGNWVGNQIKDGVTTTISGTGSPYTLTGLSNGSYEFEVVALCISPRSDPRSLTTVPYTPAISAATAINCTGFTANWPATPFVTAYLLDVSTDINFGSFVSGYQNRNVGNVLSFVVSGMQPGTLYYRIRAINTTLQSLYSATITVVPLINTYSAGSWSLGAPPTTVGTQNLVFNTSYTATADLAGCSCAVNSGNVIVKSGKTLSLINGLTVNLPGSLTFENSASLVQINNVTNSGNIKYYRNYTGGEYDYTFWSSPVAVQNLGVLSPSSDPDSFYSFDDASANNWVNENPSSTTMTIGKGYIIRGIPPPPPPAFPPGFDTLTFNGVPNNGFYSITGIIADNSYLLGNPYPSALDADAFLVANSGVLNGTLYFWTHNTPIAIGTPNPGTGLYAYSGNDYATYNATGGVGAAAPDSGTITGSAPSGGSVPTGKIASGQGFFASTKLSLSGTAIVYNNTMRVGVGSITGDNSQFYKTKNPKAKKTAQLEKHRVWLDLTNDEGAFKQTLVGYITDATNTYDDRFDGESFDGNDFLDFYSINSEKHLTIQGRGLPFDQNDEVPLGFRVAVGGNFTLKIGQKDGLLSNQEIFIEDKLINKVVNLKEGNYTFTTTAGTFDDRFKLKYTNQTLGVEEVETNDGIIALYSNNYKTLIIRNNLKDTTVNSVMLFNLAGQKIANWDVKGREQTSIQIPIKNLSSEIYIVKIETTQGEFSKKIIVK